MKNIIRIIASDIKHLSTNVVAVVVIIGLSVIPSLYAWFNIISNWDPYGEDSTKNLQVAVVSSDEGVQVAGYEVNVGNMIISNLKENKSIGWVFTDTEDEAIDLVTAGDCYAALVVNEQFSEKLLSFLGGDMEHPTIDYYENEKKNAIAPKITGKVKTTVQNEVNTAFVSTIAEVLVEASEYVVSVDETGSLTSATLDKLENLDSDLSTYILILESYISLLDSSSSLMEAAENVSDQVDGIMRTAEGMAIGTNATADSAEDAVNTINDVVYGSIAMMSTQLGQLTNMVDTAMTTVAQSADKMSAATSSMASSVAIISKTYDKYKPVIVVDIGAKDSYEKEDGSTGSRTEDVTNDLAKLEKDLNAASQTASKTGQDAIYIDTVIRTDLIRCQTSMNALANAYKYTVAPQINTSLDAVQDSVTQVQRILNYNGSSIDQVSLALNSYPKMMGGGKDSLVQARDNALEMQEKLEEIIADMKDLDKNSQYNTMVSLVQSDPALIADFISSPVNLETEEVYPVANNGSATAPFYIVLSIWVGALIMSTIYHTKVKPIPGVVDMKNHEAFIARYCVTFLTGQIQTNITIFGAFLYLGIQCQHPIKMWLCAVFTSFVFSLLLYSFTYSFGNVGEALSVILMVVQVAGSGGTFPIEVLPRVFQVLYSYMPFAYAMNAMRECVAGTYQNDYWKYMAGLIIYVVVALVIGLVLYKPMLKLNAMIEESKEKSGILI